METSPAIPLPSTTTASRVRIWLGLALVAAGLLGHLLAAHAIGGSSRAFRDHVFGFFLILVVTGTIVALLGRRFWRGRRDVTVLVVGVIQALFGVFVYVTRFSVHG
jgi:predicted membrane channel-forming protein YqfA (hemolysin III family)